MLLPSTLSVAFVNSVATITWTAKCLKAMGRLRRDGILVGVAAARSAAVGRRDLRNAWRVGGINIGTDVLGWVDEWGDVG